MKNLFLSIAFLSLFTALFAGGNGSGPVTEQLIQQAGSADPAVAAKAIAELRTYGQAGLNAFLQAHTVDFVSLQGVELEKLNATLDQIAGQKDSYYSRLFWHTDLNAALKTSQAENKPILSLRLLGNLTDELSCANSRFFRIFLYANTEVSKYLRTNYVLHWSSERPVPVMTIDFGDGRTMTRTITGNSIHYILDSEGNVLDAIPGLYSPEAFLKLTTEADELYHDATDGKVTLDLDKVKKYHQKKYELLKEIAAYNNIVTEPATTVLTTARAVEELTVAKAVVERPVFNTFDIDGNGSAPAQRKTPEKTDPWKGMRPEPASGAVDPAQTMWKNIAEGNGLDGKPDANSLALIKAKNPAKYADEIALAGDYAVMANRMTVESARNELMFRTRLHRWQAETDEPMEMAALNTRVYDELFFTSASDPWLGLFDGNVFTGIANDGIGQK